jgi:hypothetical protein
VSADEPVAPAITKTSLVGVALSHFSRHTVRGQNFEYGFATPGVTGYFVAMLLYATSMWSSRA